MSFRSACARNGPPAGLQAQLNSTQLNSTQLNSSPQPEEMRGIVSWVRRFHRSSWRKLPYMQIIHLVSGSLFGCHWRWWLRNLPAIRWSQRSPRQTSENLAASYLAPRTQDLCLPKFVSCQSCCIACTQFGWIRRSYGKFSSKVPPFYLSYPTSVHQSYFKRKRLSDILKFRQLCLFQSIAVLPDDAVRRPCSVQRSSFILQNLSAPRCRGRPKQIWASEVYRMVVEIAEGFHMLGDLRKFARFFFSAPRLLAPLVFPAHVSPYTRRMNEWMNMSRCIRR